MRPSAVISECQLYRYVLRRIWDEACQILVVIMLNPSTADHMKNDPTILTLIHFAQLWGFGGLHVVNQNAFRSPHPSALAAATDPVGPLNWRYLHEAMEVARDGAGWALAAWGNGGVNEGDTTRWADVVGVNLMCLGTTADGSPKHPLARGVHRIPRDQQPVEWRRAA